MKAISTLLFDVVEQHYGFKWHEELEQELSGFYDQHKEELIAEITPPPDENLQKILKHLELNIVNRQEEIDFYTGSRLFSLGVEIGMELQRDFQRRREE